MKKLLLMTVFLVSSILSFGQQTAVVKKTAEAMLKAQEQKHFETYVSYFYPTEIKSRGGKEKWIQTLKSNDKNVELLKLKAGKHSLGKVSKIYKAGKELHCLVDWNVPMGKMMNHWHFLAISADQGKTWKFIMTAGKTPSQVWAMVPKFNEDLSWVDYSE